MISKGFGFIEEGGLKETGLGIASPRAIFLKTFVYPTINRSLRICTAVSCLLERTVQIGEQKFLGEKICGIIKAYEETGSKN